MTTVHLETWNHRSISKGETKSDLLLNLLGDTAGGLVSPDELTFSMDPSSLLYSHFHQVIKLEPAQHRFLIILLDRLFENFTFLILRNFQMITLKFIHK